MSDYLSQTVEQELNDVSVGRSHLVILGAGASRAAFPNGDRNGKKLPLMSDFADILDLHPLLSGWGLDPSRNFEDIFSELYTAHELDKVKALQQRVEDYFEALEIGDTPTIYDHLLLSLRKKDFVATFNWDPLLLQAYRRSGNRLSLPRLIFLHGNVAAGFCARDKVAGNAGVRCSRCGKPFVQTPLLYPIKTKNYAQNEFIAGQWDMFKKVIEHTFMITIFGYSGPKTDEEAMAAMGDAWGPVANRELEQTCFITIQPENEVLANFRRFVHSHHYEIDADFYSSWIARHPRRTAEAWWNQYMECKFLPDNPIPKDANFPELWNWLEPFREPELRTDLA